MNYIYIFDTYSEATSFFKSSSIQREAGKDILSRFDYSKTLNKPTDTTIIIWKCSSPIAKKSKLNLIQLGYRFLE
jgi:hypothetical protein